ncbi:MAG: transcriptional repressor [Bdellovibrio sp. CG10_big_fil_rev_8_21_14_0_10_47_8]|nr:MAG: transcriptional repressor [Bdellovibrio sp. CG10_big_fil_rev_8_21_14_0_10_47_8]
MDSNKDLTKIPSLPRSHGEEKLIQRHDLGRQLDKKAFKQMIRTMNLKVTDQRLAILDSLHGGRTHVTAQEVFELVSEKFPEIGFATVYRFLRTLTENGFVTEVRMGGFPARYELTPQSHHDHLTCVGCGKICEFENHHIEELQQKVAKQFGFQLTSHVLELYGICPACQKRQV